MKTCEGKTNKGRTIDNRREKTFEKLIMHNPHNYATVLDRGGKRALYFIDCTCKSSTNKPHVYHSVAIGIYSKSKIIFQVQVE